MTVHNHDGEKRFSLQNYVFKVEIIYESKGVPFNQMKVSERRAEPKKTEKRYFPRSLKKTHQFHKIKNNKEVTLKTRDSLEIT